MMAWCAEGTQVDDEVVQKVRLYGWMSWMRTQGEQWRSVFQRAFNAVQTAYIQPNEGRR